MNLEDLKKLLQARAGSSGTLLVGLDFDGTLSPIVRRPATAALPGTLRRLLDGLKAGGRIRAAIVSGRSLRDIRTRVGLRGLFYAGSHGLEIDGPGLRWTHPGALAALPFLRRAARDLRRRLREVPGVLLEDKRLTLSVHFRGIPESRADRLRGLVEATVAPGHRRLKLGRGKKIWEILPRVRWNKGHALLKIARSSGARGPILFVGDDQTDEEGFRTLGLRAWTVKVGSRPGSAARFFFRGPREVRSLLEFLLRRSP